MQSSKQGDGSSDRVILTRSFFLSYHTPPTYPSWPKKGPTIWVLPTNFCVKHFSFHLDIPQIFHNTRVWWAKKHCIVCVQCLQDPWGSHSSGKTFVSSISKIISHIIIALHCLFNCCYLQKSSGVAPPLKRSPFPFWLHCTFSSVSLEKSSKDLNLYIQTCSSSSWPHGLVLDSLPSWVNHLTPS